jgi:hypothetical protein
VDRTSRRHRAGHRPRHRLDAQAAMTLHGRSARAACTAKYPCRVVTTISRCSTHQRRDRRCRHDGSGRNPTASA